MTFANSKDLELTTEKETQSNLLDPYRGNSNTARKSYCGQYTLGAPRDEEGLFPHWILFCKTYSCGVCGPIRKYLLKKEIARCIGEYKLRVMATVTLDPKDVRPEDSVKFINNLWNKHRIYQKRYLGKLPLFIKVLEFQKKTGNAHLHVLLDSYIDKKWLRDSWKSVGGGITDVRAANKKAAHYLAKYLTKAADYESHGRYRRVTTSQKIKLFAKKEKVDGFNFLKISYPEAKLILGRDVTELVISENSQKGEIGFKSKRPLELYEDSTYTLENEGGSI